MNAASLPSLACFSACSVADLTRGLRALAETGRSSAADSCLRRMGYSGREIRGFLSEGRGLPVTATLTGVARLFGKIAAPTHLVNATRPDVSFLQPLSLVAYRGLAWYFGLPPADEAFPPDGASINLPYAALPGLISLLNVFLGEDAPLRVPTLTEALDVLSFRNMMNFAPQVVGHVVAARCLLKNEPAPFWEPEITMPVEIAKKRQEGGTMRGLLSLNTERLFLAGGGEEHHGVPLVYEASLRNAVLAPAAEERFCAVPQGFPSGTLGVPLILVR